MGELIKGVLNDPVRTMKRAIKYASKDDSRPVLMAVHLDECGDVVSTDASRMYVEHGAWSGPSIDLDMGTAHDIAKCKVKGNETATIEVDGGQLTVKMGDGTEIKGAVKAGSYPKYEQLLDHETFAKAEIDPKQLLPIAREHVKLNDHMVVSVSNGSFKAEGVDGLPTLKVAKCAEGEMYVGIDPKYLRDALGIFGNTCVVRLMSPIKPIVFTDDENIRVLVMPVRIDEPKKGKAKGGFKQAPKAPEPEPSGEPLDLAGERVCITGTLPSMTRSEAFTRLKLAGGIPCERFTSKVTLFVVAADAGRTKREKAEKAIANGQKLRIVNGTEFVKALNEQGKTAGEKKMEERMAKKEIDKKELMEAIHHAAIDRAAEDRDGRVQPAPCTDKERQLVWQLGKAGRLTHETLGDLTSWYLDGEFVCCIERRWSKRKIHLCYPELKPFMHRADLVASRKVEQAAPANVEATVTEHADVTAVEIKPKEKEDTMDKRIEELEAELKAARKELDEVWKENETLKRKQDAPEPSKAPEAPKADVAATVSLAAMQAWAKERGLVASQKREGTCIWVEGESTAYRDELKEMGFRFAKKRKSWYLNPAA